MKISAKIDYACRALLELSLHWPNKNPLQIVTIARHQKIPEKFLTQILVHLRHLGYVQSHRGKNGGYLLGREPKQINLGALIHDFGGGENDSLLNDKQKNDNHTMSAIWSEVNAVVQHALEEINFEIIRHRQQKNSNVVMYDI